MNLLMVVGIPQGETNCVGSTSVAVPRRQRREPSISIKNTSRWRLRKRSFHQVYLGTVDQADRATPACDVGTLLPCPMPTPEDSGHYQHIQQCRTQ